MTLGESFPKEIARVRDALNAYRSIGPAGAFACAWIAPLLAQAEKAQAEQDVVEMVKLYPLLQEVDT